MKQKSRMIPTPHRGTFNSALENEFKSAIVSDIQKLIEKVTYLESQLATSEALSNQEYFNLRSRIEDAELKLETLETQLASTHIFATSFTLPIGVSYDTDMSTARRCSLDSTFGKIYLPVNGISHLTHVTNIEGYRASTDVNITVEDAWDSVDYSGGVTPSTDDSPENMFNGNNSSMWLRTYKLPLDSDITEVKCRVTVELPSYNVDTANVFYLRPGRVPGMSVDSFKTAQSLTSESYTTHFSSLSLNNDYKHITIPYKVSKLQFIITQNSWIEENDKKVFKIGMQEVGISYVDFDKTTYADSNNYNHIVFKVSAPEGYYFTSLLDLNTIPNIFAETSYADRNVRIKVWKGAYGTGTVILDTYTTNTLAASWAETTVTEMNVEVIMRYNNTITSGCPYSANTSPYLDGLSLVLTKAEE